MELYDHESDEEQEDLTDVSEEKCENCAPQNWNIFIGRTRNFLHLRANIKIVHINEQ